MLILQRKKDDTIEFDTADGVITVQITQISGSRVTIGVDAPKNVSVLRGELKNKQQSK